MQFEEHKHCECKLRGCRTCAQQTQAFLTVMIRKHKLKYHDSQTLSEIVNQSENNLFLTNNSTCICNQLTQKRTQKQQNKTRTYVQ